MKQQRFTNKKDLLFELVRTNFKLRYNNSFLGFVWVLLKPFLTFVVLYAVFSFFRREGIENYQVYLLLGIILYTFFNEGVVFGMSSILNTSHIILKVNFPREIALMASLVMAVINLVINLLILGIFSIFNPVSPNLVSLLYCIFILSIFFVFIYGISFFTSIILVKLRDLEHITTVVMQLLFYATPIFYPISILPERLQALVLFNPLTLLIQASRSAVVNGEIIYLKEIVLIGVIVFLLTISGNLYFRNNIKRIAELF